MAEVNGTKRDVIVIGGSAGGLEALKALVADLPANLPASMFVVIHISSDYPSIIPEILTRTGRLPAIHPKDGQPIEPGNIYVAPPDRHLLIKNGTVRVTRGPRENRHRPAIDPLFRSAARSYGPRVVGVVLSGQLDDGAAGISAIKMRNGLTVVQDPRQAIAPQMPWAALRTGQIECVLPVNGIAALLQSVSRQPARDGLHKETAMSGDIDKEASKAELENNTTPDNLGHPSVFTCPECHGTLWQVDENGMVTFRCRVGHAYSTEALSASLSESAEDALWAAMRVMQEKADLLRRLAASQGEEMGQKLREEARDYDTHMDALRGILVEHQNHTPDNASEP